MRSRARWLRWLVVAAATGGLTSCADAPRTAGALEDTSSVVVGVTSDLSFGSDIGRLRVLMRVGDDVVRDDVLVPATSGARFAFPAEFRFDALPVDAPVSIALEAFDGAGTRGEPFLVRVASTEAVPGRTMLLRARLERECIPSYQLPGKRLTPECRLPETCVAAACADPFVPREDLEEYSAAWATDFFDACKTEGHGPPGVAIGQGQDRFEDVPDGGELRLEKGPQGGLHVWIAVRTSNLHQHGSRTIIEAEAPELSDSFDPIEVSFGYDVRNDGACELYGLRYELFPNAGVLDQVIGRKVRLRAKVVDVNGDVGLDERAATLVY